MIITKMKILRTIIMMKMTQIDMRKIILMTLKKVIMIEEILILEKIKKKIILTQ